MYGSGGDRGRQNPTPPSPFVAVQPDVWDPAHLGRHGGREAKERTENRIGVRREGVGERKGRRRRGRVGMGQGSRGVREEGSAEDEEAEERKVEGLASMSC